MPIRTVAGVELAYDEDGYLPPGRHQVTVDEMTVLTVDDVGASAVRVRLLAAWRAHRDGLLSVGVPILAQWIDGSFVSAKPEPGDVDVVTLLDGDLFDALPTSTRAMAVLGFAGHQTRDWLGIDSFAIFDYGPSHLKGNMAGREKQKWDRQWGRDRANRPKGYLEVLP